MGETQVPLARPLEPAATRKERIANLKLYFAKFLVEDPQDETPFDCAVLDALDQVAREYPEPIDPPAGLIPEEDEWQEPEGEEEERAKEPSDELPW